MISCWIYSNSPRISTENTNIPSVKTSKGRRRKSSANIYRANSSQSKRPLLQAARENLEVVRLYLRLIKDLKQISLGKFVTLNEKIESVSKQLSAWQKSSKE